MIKTAAIGACALVLVFATACGQDPAEEEVPTAGGGVSEETDSSDQQAAYEDCMREHGVEMPAEGEEIPEDFELDPVALEEAMEACEELMPGGQDMEGVPPEEVEELRAWTECLREEGVDIPDPDADGTIDMEGVDVQSEEFTEADAACA